MDMNRFDHLTQVVGRSLDRRAGRRGLVAGAVAGLIAAAGRATGSAARPEQRFGADGPCGNELVKVNRCKRNKDCCTRFCNRRTKRCRCRHRGRSCTADRNCCSRRGQQMICLNGVCADIP